MTISPDFVEAYKTFPLRLDVCITDNDGTVQDLTGTSPAFRVFDYYGGTLLVEATQVNGKLVITDAVNGLMTITLPTTDLELLPGCSNFYIDIIYPDLSGQRHFMGYELLVYD